MKVVDRVCVEDGVILEIFIVFLLVTGILSCLFWLLVGDDLVAAEPRIVEAEKARDRAIDEWFQAQDNI